MSRKTRNLIWSVPLVATLAIVGALALFLTLAPNDASAQTEEEVPGRAVEPCGEGPQPDQHRADVGASDGRRRRKPTATGSTFPKTARSGTR